MEVIFTLEQIREAAFLVKTAMAGQTVLALHGEMGAGKTTLIHALCEELGVQDHTSSPTFSIINQYLTNTAAIIYHIDLYRLKDANEAISSGVEDCLYSGNTCLVEWPERAPEIFPGDTLHLHLIPVTANTRKLMIN